MSQLLRCERCGDVIGVYEPLVRVRDGRPHEGSRAVEGFVPDRGDEHYHRACYERLSEDRPTET